VGPQPTAVPTIERIYLLFEMFAAHSVGGSRRLPSNDIVVDSEGDIAGAFIMHRHARVQEESIYNLIPKECEQKEKSIRYE